MFGSTGGATIYGNRDANDAAKRKRAGAIPKINLKTHIYPVTLSPVIVTGKQQIGRAHV